MDPPYPSMTSLWHTSTYPAIDPAGRATGKTVIVTGASSGIGRATAIAFAKAGAKHVALLGRRQNLLDETKSLAEKEQVGVKVTTHAASVTDSTGLKKAAEEIGKWDILVSSAGRIMSPKSVGECDVEEWWDVLETNVKGTFLTVSAFIPTANVDVAAPAKPTIIAVSAGVVTLPPVAPPNVGASAYIASKAANLKIIEHLAAEHPKITAINAHPGVVHTSLMEVSGMVGATEEARKYARDAGYVDDESLPSHFFVWLSTPDAQFLNGRFVFANWDLEQLVARKEEILGSDLLTSVVQGWPFQPKK